MAAGLVLSASAGVSVAMRCGVHMAGGRAQLFGELGSARLVALPPD